MEIIIVIWLMAMGVKAVVEELATGRSRSAASPAGGGPRLPKYGLFDRMADSYRDSMRRSTDNMIARRDARDAARRSGTAPPTRWQRAEDRLATRWEQRRGTPPASPPQPHHSTGPAQAATPQATPTPTPAPSAPVPPVQVRPRPPAPVSAPPATGEESPTETNGEPDSPPPTEPSSTEGATPMTTGLTGEIPDHEHHMAQLDATERELREGMDLCNVVVSTSSTLRGQVDDLQAKYGPVATATQTRAEHLQALNVDQTTTGHAAEGADVLDANAVTAYHDEAANIEAGAEALRQRLETALAKLQEERAEAIKRYADAAETVKNDLSGNATYLGGNGGGGSGPAYGTPGAAAGTWTQNSDGNWDHEPEPAGASR